MYFFCTFCCFFDAGADAGADGGYLQKVHGEDVEVVEVVEDVGEGEGGEFVIVEEGEGFEDE